MSRCTICDCSQSADSLFHNSLAGVTNPNNPVDYSKALGSYVCLDCRESIIEQRNDWRVIDNATEFNAFEATVSAEDYAGCTAPVEAD